jgi:uncharacterized protein (TIGR02271 family)
MATSTIVGIFDDQQDASTASRELRDMGVDDSRITITRSDYGNRSYKSYQGLADSTGHDHGRGISGFFRRLFGDDIDDSETGVYSEAVRRGSTIVTADVEESLVEQAVGVMRRHGAVDIDRRAAQYRSSGFERFDDSGDMYSPDQARAEWQTYANRADNNLSVDNNTPLVEEVVEEELQVGKRTVNRGGVRVYTRITERPVDEVVTLREERVRVDRRPVDREATAADLNDMPEGTMHITETAEEPVVQKRARVVEEVVVDKDVDEREEHIHDTVRRRDVEVEDIGSQRRVARDRDRQ